MEKNELKGILEALFFITDAPVTFDKLKDIFGGEADDLLLNEAINEIRSDYLNRGSSIELKEVAGGFQFATVPKFSPWVKKLFREKTTIRLSPSAMETLSVIAYKQPVTRAEIEEIRGVDVMSVLEKLIEKKFVRITGRKETIGRPLLYSTTQEFLRHFGLKSTAELPPLEDLIPPETIESAEQPELTPESVPEIPVEPAPETASEDKPSDDKPAE